MLPAVLESLIRCNELLLAPQGQAFCSLISLSVSYPNIIKRSFRGAHKQKKSYKKPGLSFMLESCRNIGNEKIEKTKYIESLFPFQLFFVTSCSSVPLH